MAEITINEKDKQFAEVFSRFVNGTMWSAKMTGRELANDQSYLVQEKFNVVMYFIEQLAANYKQGYYDPRNEWSCKLANAIIENLEEKKLYFSSLSSLEKILLSL